MNLGGAGACRLRSMRQAATAARAITAAATPTPIPIFPAELIPPEPESSAASDVAVADVDELVVDVVELLVVSVGTAVEPVGVVDVVELVVVVNDDVVEVVDVVEVFDLLEEVSCCPVCQQLGHIWARTDLSPTVVLELFSDVSVDVSEVGEGFSDDDALVWDVGIGAPGGRVAALVSCQ